MTLTDLQEAEKTIKTDNKGKDKKEDEGNQKKAEEGVSDPQVINALRGT